jgi:predicted dehydrogenase
LGVQGRKRRAVAGAEAIATVDPVNREADFRTLAEVPFDAYDAALVCTPNDAKVALLTELLDHAKHVLVEKPLLASDRTALEALAQLANRRRAVCYVAYNHRFEPHFVRMKEVVDSGVLGRIYLCRTFYGNGTARDVRNSPWRDRGTGVLSDLGSHLLDTARFWFGAVDQPFEVWAANRFENRVYDHIAFGAPGLPSLEMEISLLSWRNHFTADVYGEAGSAHIESLCKWGPSTFTLRRRILPSGRPSEEAVTLVEADPTWAAEYQHFKKLCVGPANFDRSVEDSLKINDLLNDLARKAVERDARS